MPKTLPVREWRVIVGGRDIGSVTETTENLARCAALSKFGISEDEAEEGTLRKGIYPCDDFSVFPSS